MVPLLRRDIGLQNVLDTTTIGTCFSRQLNPKPTPECNMQSSIPLGEFLFSNTILHRCWRLLKVTNIKMKLRMIRTCIFPTATCRFEKWTLNRNITQRINEFENKCHMYHGLNIEHTVVDEHVVTSGTLLDFIKKQKLSYFREKTKQHITEIITKKNIGRPKRSWEKDVDD